MSSFQLYPEWQEDVDRFGGSGAFPGTAAISHPDMPLQTLPQDVSLYQMSSLPGSILSTSPVSLTFSGDTNPLATNQVSLASTPLSANFEVPFHPSAELPGLESYLPPESREVGKRYHFKEWTLKDLKGRKDKNTRTCLNCYVKSISCKPGPNELRCRSCEKKRDYCKGDIEMSPLIKKEFLEGRISFIPCDNAELQEAAEWKARARNLSATTKDCDLSHIQIDCNFQQAEAPFEAQILQTIDRVGQLFRTTPQNVLTVKLRTEGPHDIQVVSRRVCACLVLFGNLSQCIVDFQDGQMRPVIHVALAFFRQLVLQVHNAFEGAFARIREWIQAKRSGKSDTKKTMAIIALHLGEMHRELALVHSYSVPNHPLRHIMSNLTETLSKLAFYGRSFSSDEFTKGQQKDIISLPLIHLHTSTDRRNRPHLCLSLSDTLDAYGPLCASKNQNLSLEAQPTLLRSADADPLHFPYTPQNNDPTRHAWDDTSTQEARMAQWQASPMPPNMSIASLRERNADIVEKVTELLRIKSINDDQIQRLQNEKPDHRKATYDGVALATGYQTDDLGLSVGDVNMEDVNFWHSSSWAQDEAPLIDMGEATQSTPAQSIQQGLAVPGERQLSLLDPPNAEVLRQRKRKRVRDQSQASTSLKDFFDHRIVGDVQPPDTEVIPTHPEFDKGPRTDRPLTQDNANSHTDQRASRASVQGSSAEIRSPPSSPGGEPESESEQSETTVPDKARRPITWPTRAVRRSWSLSVKTLVKVFEELNPN